MLNPVNLDESLNFNESRLSLGINTELPEVKADNLSPLNQASEKCDKESGSLTRFILPDRATTVVSTPSGETIRYLVTRLLNERGFKSNSFDVFIKGNDKLLDLSEDCSSLGGCEVQVEVLHDLDITLPIQQGCAAAHQDKIDLHDNSLPRPPRTSTPIQEVREEDTADLDYTSILFKEHSYSSVQVTGVLASSVPASNVIIKNRESLLSSLLKQNWSQSRVLKSKDSLKRTSIKSKKITKPPKRKIFSREQISIATHILYGSRRTYKMLRNQKLIDLPHPRTVYRHLQHFKCRPGFTAEIRRLLSLFLSSLDPEDRICGVLVDEVKLAEQMSWSPRLKTVFKAHKVLFK